MSCPICACHPQRLFAGIHMNLMYLLYWFIICNCAIKNECMGSNFVCGKDHLYVYASTLSTYVCKSLYIGIG